MWWMVIPPGADLHWHGRAEVRFTAAGRDRANEVAVLVMVQYRLLVGAGDHQHAAVLQRMGVEAHADGQHVIVGVGIEGDVLMPLDRAAAPGRLHVELLALVANVWTEQRLDHIQNGVRAVQLSEKRVALARRIDAGEARRLGAVPLLQRKRLGIARDTAGLLGQFVHDPLGLGQLRWTEHILDGEIPIVAVELDLRRTEPGTLNGYHR